MNELKKELTKQVSKMCKGLGFRKTKGAYFIPISDDIWGSLMFGMYCKYGHVLVDVVVGIRVEKVEQLILDLTETRGGYNDKKFHKSTISSQIGYLMPEKDYKDWDFYAGNDNSILMEDLRITIQTYAFQYYKKYNTFNSIYNLFLMGKGINISYREEYLPAFFYVNGEKEKGIQFIKETIEKYKNVERDWYLTVEDLNTREVKKYDIRTLSDEEFWNLQRLKDVIIRSPESRGVNIGYDTFVKNYMNLK